MIYNIPLVNVLFHSEERHSEMGPSSAPRLTIVQWTHGLQESLLGNFPRVPLKSPHLMMSLPENSPQESPLGTHPVLLVLSLLEVPRSSEVPGLKLVLVPVDMKQKIWFNCIVWFGNYPNFDKLVLNKT